MPQERCRCYNRGVGYGTKCSLDASIELAKKGISFEVIDLRVLNPLNLKLVIESVSKTRRVDLWLTRAGNLVAFHEVLASLVENMDLSCLKNSPVRISLPGSPAPTSARLEEEYYFDYSDVVDTVMDFFGEAINESSFL